MPRRPRDTKTGARRTPTSLSPIMRSSVAGIADHTHAVRDAVTSAPRLIGGCYATWSPITPHFRGKAIANPRFAWTITYVVKSSVRRRVPSADMLYGTSEWARWVRVGMLAMSTHDRIGQRRAARWLIAEAPPTLNGPGAARAARIGGSTNIGGAGGRTSQRCGGWLSPATTTGGHSARSRKLSSDVASPRVLRQPTGPLCSGSTRRR